MDTVGTEPPRAPASGDADAPRAGRVLAGRYRLEAPLGAGGGGTVWRCRDQELGVTVALKVVGSDSDVERWRREVVMARRIVDRRVCRVYDLGEADGIRFVTMELVEGSSLRSQLARPLDAAGARRLFVDLVAGTAAIHEAGVVHRDLKPENVVVAPDGRAVIVDFGLAREPRTASMPSTPVDFRPPVDAADDRRGNVTHVGEVLGTPRYMSPEQAAGKTIDPRSDVYALGLIGHELLCNTLPELGPDGPLLDTAALDRSWPGLAPILRRCLASRRRERFHDAGELAAAIAELRPVGRARPWLRPALIAVAGAIAVAAIAAVLLRGRATPGEPRLARLTTTSAGDWPALGPMSVAISPDASRYAFTTGGAALVERTFDGASTRWPVPMLDGRPALVSMWAAGWFGDGALAVFGATRDGDWQLYKIRPDGRQQLLYRHDQRFTVAVDAAHDRVALAVNDYAVFVLAPGAAEPSKIAPVGVGEQIVKLAWSPRGDWLAVGRMPAEAGADGIIQLMSPTGEEQREVWRGRTVNYVDLLLVWLDDERLAFTLQDPVTRQAVVSTIDVATRAVTVRARFDDYVGWADAARGVVLFLRGDARYAVAVGDRNGTRFAPVHDATVQGVRVSGWLRDGRVVFAAGSPGKYQIVRARPGGPLEPWPGTSPGIEQPDTVVEDNVVAHRTDGDTVVVERITPTGQRFELARLRGAVEGTPVRCAGDRTTPCILEQVTGNRVAWTLFDPMAVTLLDRVHDVAVRERYMRGAALSVDGQHLAIVDGGHDVIVVDRARVAERTSAGNGAALQTLAWGAGGELYATSIGFRGRLFGLMAFEARGGRIASEPRALGDPAADSLRWYARPTPSHDGERLAITMREFRLDVWRLDDL